MSWTQGIEMREDMPDHWIIFCENMYAQQFGSPVSKVDGITWDEVDITRFTAIYEDGSTITFRMKEK